MARSPAAIRYRRRDRGHSRKDRSLSIRIDPSAPDGFLLHSHAGDDWRAARDYVRGKLGLPEWQPGDEQNRRVHPTQRRAFDEAAVNREAERRPRTEDDNLRITRARAIWDEATDPRGTLAEQYLQSRALRLTDDIAGSVLRFHPRCPWRNEDTGQTVRIPALIAAFGSIDDDAITGIHRIRLDEPARWPKTERRMLGIVHRAAVKFDPISGDTLLIAEGIETTMAARQLGYRPAWALGSVGGISFFPALDGSGRCWRRAGRHVQVIYSEVGSDLNDALMQRASDGQAY